MAGRGAITRFRQPFHRFDTGLSCVPARSSSDQRKQRRILSVYGDSGQIGVYVTHPTDPYRVVADLNTPIPGGFGNFTGFVPPNPVVPPNPIISGDVVAFLGRQRRATGHLRVCPAQPDHASGFINGARRHDQAIPGGVPNTTFGYFQSVSMEDTNVAFLGGAVGIATSDGGIPDQLGVYKDIGSGWQRVADLTTAAPGGSGLFSSFGAVAIDPGYVVFEGYDANGVHGLYSDFPDGLLHKIIAAGDPVGGKTLSDFYWSQFGFSAGTGAQVVFAADYSDGSHAITVATLTNGPCPHSQGYWKNNPKAWPVSSLTLGSQAYSKSELLNIVKTSTMSDASMILARQLIAAKLNIANGSDPSPLSSTITHADSLLSGYASKLPYRVKTTSATGKAMVNDATTLNYYNNGHLSQFCGR